MSTKEIIYNRLLSIQELYKIQNRPFEFDLTYNHVPNEYIMCCLVINDIIVYAQSTSVTVDPTATIDTLITLTWKRLLDMIIDYGIAVVYNDTKKRMEEYNKKIDEYNTNQHNNMNLKRIEVELDDVLNSYDVESDLKAKIATDLIGRLSMSNPLKVNNTVVIDIINKSKNELPTYASEGSAGFDLCVNIENGAEFIGIARGETVLIKTGLFVAIPFGKEMQIRSKSGLAYKCQIIVLNSPGCIDSDYRGEIGVLVHNHGSIPRVFKQGDQIAQVVINDVYRAKWNPVDSLKPTNRGRGGFGHSYKNQSN